MLEHITSQLAAEIAAHAVTPEQIRAVIHPVIPILYRSQDDVAEADEIQRSKYVSKRSKQLKHMTFAATARCKCGAGLAYDATCAEDPFRYPSYWDCSAILLSEAIPSGEPGAVEHTGRLPFTFYEIKSENQPSARGATTRPE